MPATTTTRRPAHLRLTESLVDPSGVTVCSAVVREYRTRKGAEARKAASERRSAANYLRDPRYRAVYTIERIPMGERA